jgi:FKBP-type peptidyl-prolyl cis-trans isomerase SlpA
MSTQDTVQRDSQVTLHFSLALPDGEVIDSNFDAKPASFRLGDGTMLPGFETCLLGRKAGEEFQTSLTPDQAFGKVNAANIHRLDRARFSRFLEEEYEALRVGTVVAFKDPAGFDLPGVVKEKTGSSVLIDFNHPLAGKEILFRARIVAVFPGDTSTVQVRV